MSSSRLDFSSFRDSLKFLIPIIITIALAAFFTTTVKYTYFPGNTTITTDITPIPQPPSSANDPIGTVLSATANALFYVIIALIGGFFLVFLIRSGRIHILEMLFAIMMGISIFLFSDFVFVAILVTIFNLFPDLITYVTLNGAEFLVSDGMFYFTFILGVITFMTLAFERFRSQNAHNVIMVLFGSLMGTVFGVFFPVETLFFVLLALALYDIYAVFFGPIRKMFESNEFSNEDLEFANNSINSISENSSNIETNVDLNENQGEEKIYLKANTANITTPPTDQKDFFTPNNTNTYNETTPNISERRNMRIKPARVSLPVYMTPDINIGLGDFVFFSVLVAKAFYEGISTMNFWYFILPVAGILIGAYTTFRLLERREILPALPIPIFCGLAGYVIAIIIGIVFY